ncbi:hypothetical protein HZS_2467 [Henneguya salminicola]|nr:hypothetical protein HZS_2467 [Henneguya salminicola]
MSKPVRSEIIRSILGGLPNKEVISNIKKKEHVRLLSGARLNYLFVSLTRILDPCLFVSMGKTFSKGIIY